MKYQMHKVQMANAQKIPAIAVKATAGFFANATATTKRIINLFQDELS